jgi:hypothetical protein
MLHSKQNDNDEHMTAAGGEDVGGTVEVDAGTVSGHKVQAGPLVLLQQGR